MMRDAACDVQVMPAVTRSLRRTPDVAMSALTALLEVSPVPLEAHAAELTTILVQQVGIRTEIHESWQIPVFRAEAQTLQAGVGGRGGGIGLAWTRICK